MSDFYLKLFQLIVLYSAMTFHEVAHGMTAYKLGDDTAKLAGRLTFNPLKHIDTFGTVILPLILFLINSPFVVAYAKPVPFNPLNFRNIKKGTILTGLAGPVSNIGLAIFFGLLIRLLDFFGFVSPYFFLFLSIIIFFNLLLAFFNLAPFPPFDGHHIAFSLLSDKYHKLKEFLTRNYLIFLLIWILWIFPYLFVPLTYRLSTIFMGSPMPF